MKNLDEFIVPKINGVEKEKVAENRVEIFRPLRARLEADLQRVLALSTFTKEAAGEFEELNYRLIRAGIGKPTGRG